MRGDSFVDSVGFNWGAQNLHFWDLGGEAKLYATIPNGQLTWTPFVAATIDQQLGYSHSLDVPLQAGQAADTIYIGQAQTVVGARIGISGLDKSGLNFGISGLYYQSSEFQIIGGQAFIRYLFPDH